MSGTQRRPKDYITLILVLVGVGILVSPPQSVADRTPQAPVQLVEAAPESVRIEFTLPEYDLRTVVVHDQTFTQIVVPGLSISARPGTPQLPQAASLIGLPPQGAVSLQVIESEQRAVPLTHPIYPAPVPGPVHTTGAGSFPAPTYTPTMDESVYGQDSPYPAQAVTLEELGQVRGHRVARVAFHPFRYCPIQHELQVTQHILVEVRFQWNSGAAWTDAAQAISPPFASVLDRALLNYEAAQAWQTVRPTRLTAAANPPATQPDSLKIVIDRDGLYHLTYASLEGLLPVDSVDPTTFQLFEQGQEVAVTVEGEGDHSFDPGDSILFYGRVPRSRYTDRNVYWLRYGDTTGLRMASRDGTPGGQPAGDTWATARYEENRFYDPKYPAADGDHWYAANLRPLPGYDHTASLSLMPLDTGATTATLRVKMVGYTPNHHATFQVNGQAAGSLAWSGHSPVTATNTLNRAMLRSGSNGVRVAVTAANEGTWLDAVEIDYAFQAVTGNEATFRGQAGTRRYTLDGFTSSDVRLYDIGDARHPIRLVGGTGGGGSAFSFADAPAQRATYLALTGTQIRQPVSILADTPSDLHGSTNGADYLIVIHASFAQAIAPLASYRQSQGLRVAVIDVEDIYDEFSGGQFTPEAIRSFIAYAYNNWTPPAPLYVLLVGDGSYDFLDHFHYGSANYIPPYLDMVDPWWGETAADNLYAGVDGDQLADVWLGRLPVTTAAEATTVVLKILEYEQTPWLGNWNARHVFVADERDYADNDFAALADAVYDAHISDPWVGSKVYLDDMTAEAARQETMNAWQRGALLVSYVGHSSWHQWAVANLFDVYDVPGLHNDKRLPVLLSMTCFTGFFHHPEYGTLDESLLRLQGGGAIATFSPSGLGVATGHDHLFYDFYEAVFTDGQTELGQAVESAKLDLVANAPAHLDLLDTYHLFGDPAMALNLTIRPWPQSVYLPLLAKNH
jgi:hypothetical protein